jgi:adenylate cyclase
MAEQRVERRLTAILAGDVAGYSRLMGADEEGTLRRLNAHRREFLEPTIVEYRGRIVKRTGDGVLIEFASAVDAARCAAEIQRGMSDRNQGVPSDSRIELRIGIHVGDIIFEEDDILETASTLPLGWKVSLSLAAFASLMMRSDKCAIKLI